MLAKSNAVFYCLVTLFWVVIALPKPPNIVFILTDDQDTEIGGETPMSKTKKLIGDQGAIFTNMFATSPLCCPSRSSILTGRYVHNHGAVNNSISGNCSSPAWQKESETRAFATYMKKRNYNTFFAGKYLNQYGKKAAGGPSHKPPGWDWWIGLVGNSQYYNYTLSVNWTREKHKDDYKTDYLTDLINRHGTDFLNLQSRDGPPFLMMLSTPACHAPFTPAPQYKDNYSNLKAPRSGSFNVHGKDKHWLIRQAKTPMASTSIEFLDNAFRNRWRTLLSVDDMVQNVIDILDKKNLLGETYVFFSSDNGYHLGQFSLPEDKRQMYEFDIRVPLMVRGPGIKPGQIRKEPISNIDFAPTFVALSGQNIPLHMDGQSFALLLTGHQEVWRSSLLIEHQGEYHYENAGCPQYNGSPLANCFPDCVCEDAMNNTYLCVRTVTSVQNTMYCKFFDDEKFVEMYNLTTDPNQLDNMAKGMNSDLQKQLKAKLEQFATCEGKSCHDFSAKLVKSETGKLEYYPESDEMKALDSTSYYFYFAICVFFACCLVGCFVFVRRKSKSAVKYRKVPTSEGGM